MPLDINQYYKSIRKPAKLDLSQIIKYLFMSNILYLVGVLLIIGWMIGWIGLHAGGLIHLLLVAAIIVILLRIIQGSRVL